MGKMRDTISEKWTGFLEDWTGMSNVWYWRNRNFLWNGFRCRGNRDGRWNATRLYLRMFLSIFLYNIAERIRPKHPVIITCKHCHAGTESNCLNQQQIDLGTIQAWMPYRIEGIRSSTCLAERKLNVDEQNCESSKKISDVPSS